MSELLVFGVRPTQGAMPIQSAMLINGVMPWQGVMPSGSQRPHNCDLNPARRWERRLAVAAADERRVEQRCFGQEYVMVGQTRAFRRVQCRRRQAQAVAKQSKEYEAAMQKRRDACRHEIGQASALSSEQAAMTRMVMQTLDIQHNAVYNDGVADPVHSLPLAAVTRHVTGNGISALGLAGGMSSHAAAQAKKQARSDRRRKIVALKHAQSCLQTTYSTVVALLAPSSLSAPGDNLLKRGRSMERQLASCKRHRRHARREGVRNCKSNGTSRVRVKGRVVCWAARRAGRQRCAGARVAHRRIVHARAQQRTEPKIADGRACRSAAYIRAWAEKAQAVLGFTRSVQLLGGGKRGATGNIKKSAQKTERGQSSAKSFTERSFALNDASIFDVLQSLPCGVEELRDACVKAGINPRPRVQGQRKFLSNDAMRVALCVARGHSREEALLAIGKPRAQLRAQLEGPDGLAMIASTQQSLLWQWCVWFEVLGAGQSSCVAIRATSMEALRKLLADAMRHPTAAIQAACLTPDVCMKAAWVAAADGRLEASVARVEAGRKARGCVERARFRSGAAPAELVDEERDSRFVARLKRRLAAGLYDDHTAAALARRLPDVNAAARQGLLHRRRNRDVEAGVPEQDAQVACDISDANSVELMLVEDVAAENDNLGQAVRDALFKSAMEFAMCCQAADLPVSSALFAAIDADPAVRQSLRAAGQSFDDRIRAVVRRELHLGVQGLAFAKSFWNPQDEFCKLTIQEACRRATGKRCATAGCKSGCSCGKDGCVAPATSIKAIRWLRKYFPEELQVAARASLKQDEDVWESWEAQLTALETEGVRVVRSACCSAPFETCDAVRSDGLTNTWLPPVLPVFPVADAGDMGQRRIAFMDSYTDRRPQEVHGSAIMYLPSDFLCFACQGALFDLNVDGLSQTATAEWCRKMGVRVMALEHAAMHAFLKVEQTRLQRRRKAMQIASTSAASGFDEFEQCLQHDMFAQSSIVAMMCSQFMKALPPGEFWDGPGLNQLHCVRCCFGLEQRFVGQPEELWFSVAVPTCEQPGRWSDYTGRYGFCCPKLWLLRAWSMARGGVAQLNDAELAQLQAAEAQHDAAYVQVKTCPTLSSSYFICRAAYAIKPSG